VAGQKANVFAGSSPPQVLIAVLLLVIALGNEDARYGGAGWALSSLAGNGHSSSSFAAALRAVTERAKK
jgi:hypothetical protein